MNARIDRLLGRIALTVTLLLVIVLAATVGRVAGRRALESLGWLAPSTSSYVVGDTLDLPPEVYRATPFTLVLFARSTCAACEAAAPFFQSIATEVAARSNARMVLSSPVDGPNASEIAYAHALGLEDRAVTPWRGVKPRVRNVPTLVMVNDAGVVLAAWQGAPAAADQPRVLQTIRSTLGR